MAKKSKSVLKTYFESGDIPNQSQYEDLIDSQFNLTETETQIIEGTLSSSAGIFDYINLRKGYLRGIGIDSAKVGTTFAVGRSLEVVGTASVDHLQLTGGNISASGNLITTKISASGIISSSDSLVTHFITASGGITSSGGITASSAHFSGPITASRISSSGDIDVDGQVSASSDVLTHFITASGGITSSGGITASSAYFRTDVTSSGIIKAEHLYSTDDAQIDDDLTVGGSTTFEGTPIINNDVYFLGKKSNGFTGTGLFRVNTGNNVQFGDTSLPLTITSSVGGMNIHSGGDMNIVVGENGGADSIHFKQKRTNGTYASGIKMDVENYFISASGGFQSTNSTVIFLNLPTSDPSEVGQLWNDGGTLKVSSG